MWEKKGLLYYCSGKHGFDQSHCHKPTPLVLSDKLIRIYFGTRDSNNISRTTFVDVDISDINNLKIVNIAENPVLDTGKIGAFDDAGANVSSLLRVGNKIYMYFIGWNPGTTVHTRNAIGVAISEDGGDTFRRMYDGPILDRNKIEPYYTGAVDVIQDNGSFKMWYTSGVEWKMINDKPEIWYHIKYAESGNGIDWVRNDISCILPKNEFEATARPCVIRENGIFKMWYSRRSIKNFRTNKEQGYRGGYAESGNGKDWQRMDDSFGLELSDAGWDSEEIAYPYICKVKGDHLMFYNGNNFGETGFGYAIKK